MSGTSDVEGDEPMDLKVVSGEPQYLLDGAPYGIEEEEAAVAELDDEDEFADVPQGKPTGATLFAGVERKEEPCSTCQGAGYYEVTIFGAPDANGDRFPEQVKKRCATCYGTGKETVVVMGG